VKGEIMEKKVEFEATVHVPGSFSFTDELELRATDGMQFLRDGALDGRRFRVTLTPVEPELKPCPFCGGEAKVTGQEFPAWSPNKAARVVCCNPECAGTTGRYFRSFAEAITAWNRRGE
jgi:Lar family restriction alleviation protein